MADKLEPCPTPWCDEAGGEPYVFTRRKDCFGVYCPSCSVATPYFPTREEAVEFWNTRPEAADEITRLNAENERLRGEADHLLHVADCERARFEANEAALADARNELAACEEALREVLAASRNEAAAARALVDEMREGLGYFMRAYEGIAADSFDGIEERYALLLQEGHARGRLALAQPPVSHDQ